MSWIFRATAVLQLNLLASWFLRFFKIIFIFIIVVYNCSWFNNPFELLLGTPHEPQIDHEHVSMFDLFRENGYEPGYLLKNLMNNFTILFYLHYHSISSLKIEKKHYTHTHFNGDQWRQWPGSTQDWPQSSPDLELPSGILQLTYVPKCFSDNWWTPIQCRIWPENICF